MNIDENSRNKVKIIGKNRKFSHSHQHFFGDKNFLHGGPLNTMAPMKNCPGGARYVKLAPGVQASHAGETQHKRKNPYLHTV